MTVTLLTSQSAPAATDADALVTGVFQGPDGPVLTLSTDEIDLMAALTALGATGKPEEITKIPTTGRLATPVVVAVGLGPEPGAPGAGLAERQAYLERLRRAERGERGHQVDFIVLSVRTGPSGPWNTPVTRASASVAVGADWLVSSVTVILLIVGHWPVFQPG